MSDDSRSTRIGAKRVIQVGLAVASATNPTFVFPFFSEHLPSDINWVAIRLAKCLGHNPTAVAADS